MDPRQMGYLQRHQKQRECRVPGWQEVGIIGHAEGCPQKPWANERARGGSVGQTAETQLRRSSWLKREV